MATGPLPDPEPVVNALRGRCPRCRTGALYLPGMTLTLRSRCESCGLNFAEHDCGDGPAVFLIFILGFLLVPLALFIEHIFHPPLWVHAVIATTLALGFTLATLRPLKAYIIALQFKHRPGGLE